MPGHAFHDPMLALTIFGRAPAAFEFFTLLLIKQLASIGFGKRPAFSSSGERHALVQER